MLKFIIYASCLALLSTVTYFLVKGSDGKSSTKAFTALISSSLFWITSLWLADSTNSEFVALKAINFAVFFFSIVTWILLYFSLVYDNSKRSRDKIFLIIAIAYNAIFLVAAVFGAIIPEVSLTQYGASIINPSRLYDLHVIQANGFALGALLMLNIKKRKLEILKKKQIAVMTLGLSIAVVGNILPGVISTYSDNLQWLNYIGTFSMTLFITLVGYAIIRHKLFDVRSVVARSFAYLLVLLTIAALFVGVALPLVTLIVPQDFSENQTLILYTVLAVLISAVFQPVKRFFDRVTNKIFYRDAYETQAILDRVSGVIVGSVDPHKVQRGALEALTAALKPTYISFLLYKHTNDQLHHGDLMGESWEVHDPMALNGVLKKIGRRLTLYDEIEEKKQKIREVLRIENINLVAPLVTKDETIGYLLLGPKKSGNIYNSQDIGLLNIASNELAVALQNAQRFEEIRAFNITLQEKITEATRELKVTNKKLVALDEAKDEFISMASHQLRTPLTSIKGYISMIIEGDLGKVNAAQAKALKEAFTSSQRMVFLISDFLNVSRIKTGKFVIELKELFMPTMIQEELSQLKEMFEAKELEYIYEAPEEFPMVKLDDNKMRQVMMNMIDNAIYYTQTGGKITIQLYSTGEEVIFKVIDTGIGVPKSEQHKLFTKFFRAGNARKARPDGTGLGLYMAQKVVAEQGGAVIFESIEGQGSTFGFRFPLSKIKA